MSDIKIPPGAKPWHTLTAAELTALRAVGVTGFYPGMPLTKNGQPWLYVVEVIGDINTGLTVKCEPGAPPPPKG